MLTAARQRLTYSNVIATMALFIALGGVAVAAGLPRNSVGPKQLKRGAVTAAKIRKQAVTSAKLAPKSVINGKLGPNSVGPGNIGNGAVTTAKLAKGSVIAETIKNSVVTTNKLNNEAVTTPKLANEAVTSAKLGKGSVTLGKLADEVAPLLGTLKPGQTLRGVFDVGGKEPAITRDAVSFQFPLANAPSVTVLKKDQTSANCTGLGGGNLQTPQATAGNLCVYVTEEVNLGTLAVENNTRLGFGLKTEPAGAGDFFAFGQPVGGDGALGAQLGQHGLGHLVGADRGLPLAGKVWGAEAAVEHCVDGHLDSRSVIRTTEAVAQHHRCREEGGEGVGDALAGDVGGRAVDRLEQAGLAVGAEAGRRQHSQRAGEHRRLVAEDVAEEVLGDDHVEVGRARDQLHRRVVDQQVVEGDVRVVRGYAADHLAPESRCLQHVCLVDRGDARLAARAGGAALGGLEADPGDPLDLRR
jgi:hypothetical protein